MQPEPTAMKVYGVPLSVHTRKVILGARLKSVPYTPMLVVPIVPEETPSNWRSLSPTGLIPAIDDGGYVLADSTAILLYLERRFPAPPLLPRHDRDYGAALFLDSWAGSELFRRIIHPLFHELTVGPKLGNRATDANVVKQALEHAVPEAFEYLEQREPQRFLVGGALSIADLAVISNLIQYHYLGFRIDARRYPRLAAYFAHHLRSPLVAGAFDAERPFAENLGFDREFIDAAREPRPASVAPI